MSEPRPAKPPLLGRKVAVLGGDGREVEVLRRLIADGAEVRACGCPPASMAIAGPQYPDPAGAIAGMDAVVTPIPVIGAGGVVYAPSWPQTLRLDAAAFADAKRGALVLVGTPTTELWDLSIKHGFRLIAYGDDEELSIMRAPAVAEGALRLAIEHTDVSIHRSAVAVVGFGRLGFTLARLLLALGAEVTVVARDAVQRARAWQLGAHALPLEQLAEACAGAVMIFSTVPAPVLDRGVLARARPGTFLLDLADPPGGTDFEAAREFGVDAVLGRGLGGRAPRTVGGLQYQVIRRILVYELEGAL